MHKYINGKEDRIYCGNPVQNPTSNPTLSLSGPSDLETLLPEMYFKYTYIQKLNIYSSRIWYILVHISYEINLGNDTLILGNNKLRRKHTSQPFYRCAHTNKHFLGSHFPNSGIRYGFLVIGMYNVDICSNVKSNSKIWNIN